MRDIKFRGKRLDNGEWFDAELMLVKGDGCIELNHNDGMYTDRDSAEVIGNIYENPELLEG